PDAEFVRQRNHEPELGILFQDWNDVLSQELPDQHEPHHGPILIAIADQQRSIVLKMRKCRDEFCFRPALQTKSIGTPGLQDLLNNLVQLVNFYRVHADVGVLVLGFFNRFAEGRVQFSDARSQKILKSNQQRELNLLLLQILRDRVDIDSDGISQN